MEKERARRQLEAIEDSARQAYRAAGDLVEEDHTTRLVFYLIAQLAQTIREEIVQ